MTWTGNRFLAAIGLVGTLALGGCYDDGYYGGVSVGSGYYGGGWYDDYWGSGYYRPGYYSGWYDGYYYPGSGYYVYSRSGQRHRWNDGQRRYWEGRRDARRGDDDRNRWNGAPPRPSWGDRSGGNRWNRNDGRDDGGRFTRPPMADRTPPSGRGQDMTAPRSGWNQGTAPRTRSEGGGGSRRDGWRGKRD